jgi:hypothetical protein
MGLIRAMIAALLVRGGAERLLRAGGQAARIWRPDATRALELGAEAYAAAHASHLAEFAHARSGRFDAFVNGLNRLPRPLLALGTLGLFVYAMADPAGFAVRMRGLAEVPEPMWWLLGAVVAFYFGAREAHHLREHRALAPVRRAPAPPEPPADPVEAAVRSPNAALADWRAAGGDRLADPLGRERD